MIDLKNYKKIYKNIKKFGIVVFFTVKLVDLE